MVAAKLAGNSTTAIAQAEGLSRRWTGQELESAECRQIILDLVARQSERIGRLFEMSLTSIEEAFKATRMAMFQGAAVDLGADHFARLAAAKRFLEVVSLGRPTAATSAAGKTSSSITVEELQRIVDERKSVVQ